MDDTNVGLGMVPHKVGCRCDECRIERLQGELRIKSEFLSARQCPDHSGKWERGRCLQCEIEKQRVEIEQLRAENERLGNEIFTLHSESVETTKNSDYLTTEQLMEAMFGSEWRTDPGYLEARDWAREKLSEKVSDEG